MPIYEFKCKECKTGFESLMLPGHESDESCPNCGSAKVDKLFSAFATLHSSTAYKMACCGNEEQCNPTQCQQAGSCGNM